MQWFENMTVGLLQIPVFELGKDLLSGEARVVFNALEDNVYLAHSNKRGFKWQMREAG